MHDVIIVGGGLAGLAAGALLAHHGVRLLVLERRPVLGGRALTVRQQGFTLNYGVHYIVGGYNAPHYRILRHIGKVQAAPLAPVDNTRLYRMRSGRLHRVPTTPATIVSTGLLSARGKWGLARAFLTLMTANPDKLWHTPIGDWLDTFTAEPTLRQFFLDLCGPLTFEAVPEALSAAHFVLAVRPQLMPKGPVAQYPVGGWGTMFDALRARIEEAGGEVRLKTQVERLAMEDGKFAGVWAGGEMLPGRAVILTLPPAELAALLQETPLPGLEPDRLAAIRPTMGVAVDLGTMGLKNDHIGALELPELNGTMGIHNLFEPSLAPPGGHIMQFLRFMTPEQMADKADVERTEAMLLGVLEKIWPDIHEKIVLRRTLIRPVVTAAAHRYDQPRPTLLRHSVPQAVGVFLAGDATASPGELSGIAGESAVISAGLAAAHLGVPFPKSIN
jgi:phytoene dehydrogenase-like protein